MRYYKEAIRGNYFSGLCESLNHLSLLPQLLVMYKYLLLVSLVLLISLSYPLLFWTASLHLNSHLSATYLYLLHCFSSTEEVPLYPGLLPSLLTYRPFTSLSLPRSCSTSNESQWGRGGHLYLELHNYTHVHTRTQKRPFQKQWNVTFPSVSIIRGVWKVDIIA